MSNSIYSPILELRRYTLHTGRRDELIELFEREFVETQEAVGIQLIGQFYDLDDPDQFVWLRGFNDMAARAQSLHAFYSGPVWKAHRVAANATMLDSDNVLLLRPVHPTSGFSLKNRQRPARDSRATQDGFLAVTIYWFNQPPTSEFINYFEHTIHPELMEADAALLAYFVTEDSPNTFPALPVRQDGHTFVWFAGFQDDGAYESYLSRLEGSKLWKSEIAKFLKKHLRGKPEILRLAPTPRSRLTGRV
ncbi:MAG TPA: NIPSNAP family protein [Anaerolineales bacterium]|nr:NIPSNAP family protein [Anaerolineales bacterium]